jgi:hypothetical protein
MTVDAAMTQDDMHAAPRSEIAVLGSSIASPIPAPAQTSAR